MKIKIPYHKDCIEISIPEDNILDIKKPVRQKSIRDEKEIILEALESPIASNRLGDISRGKESAVIIVSDITRSCPSYKFLPYIIDELKEAKIKEIQVIFSLGTHRKHTEEEKIKLVGEYVLNKVKKLIDFDENSCTLIGYTKVGTPIEIFEPAIASDLLIATGNLEYHYFAGYSGGAKAAMPGVCSRKTIKANHSMMLHKKATTGTFVGNPVRMDIEDAGRMIGIDFIFNVILDDEKNIIAAFSGKNNEAFLEGITMYDDINKMEVDKKADIVITSPGGYPKDMNLYQSHKALDNVKGVVKEGGVIILIAACQEGFGEKVFEEWMVDAKEYNKLSSKIKEEFVLGGHKAVALSQVLTEAKVFLYSDFNAKDTENMGFYKITNLQDYLDKIIAIHRDCKIAIVPTGRFVQVKG
jgi:nickel-dependent lactate racemase